MLIGVQCNVVYLLQQFSERLITPQIGSNNEHVEKEPDQRFMICQRTTCNRNANDDIELPGQPAQQQLKCGQHQSESRRPGLPAKFAN